MIDCKIAEPPWNYLKVFYTVTKLGSLSGAAKCLNISHSTVCRNITQLEHTMDVTLIRRLANGIVLTKDGEKLAIFVKRMADNVNDIQFWLKQKQDHVAGTLTISCCDIALSKLSILIGEFSKYHPHVQFEISASPINVDLRQAGTDIAIRATNSPDEDLIAMLLQTFPLKLASKFHFTEGSQVNWVGLNDNFRHLPSERWKGKEKSECRHYIKTDSYMCVGEIIRAGGGIGLLPNFIVDNDNMLVDIPSDNTLPQWNLYP